MLHVITMHSKSKKWTSSDDMFGPIVSLCAKINSMAPINGMTEDRIYYTWGTLRTTILPLKKQMFQLVFVPTED
jgi:hypothetical protein